MSDNYATICARKLEASGMADLLESAVFKENVTMLAEKDEVDFFFFKDYSILMIKNRGDISSVHPAVSYESIIDKLLNANDDPNIIITGRKND